MLGLTLTAQGRFLYAQAVGFAAFLGKLCGNSHFCVDETSGFCEENHGTPHFGQI